MQKCFLIGCRRRAPAYHLTEASYQYFADVFRVILREANNDSDFIDVREVFDLSSLIGFSRNGAVILLKAGIRFHEAWRNEQFWKHCFSDMVAGDTEHIGHEYTEKVDTIATDLFQMDPLEFKSFLIVNRAQALARSMKSLGLRNSMIRDVIHACAGEYPGEDLSEELFRPPSKNFVTWLLDVALIATEKELSEPIDKTLMFNSKPRYTDLGYSPLQQLIFFVIDKLCRTNILVKMPGICFCGLPLGGWQPLGLYDPTATQRELLPLLICEQCYRLLTVRPLQGHTGRSGCLVTLGRAAVPVIAPLAPDGVFNVFDDTVYIGELSEPFRLSQTFTNAPPGISAVPDSPVIDHRFKTPSSEEHQRLSRGEIRFQERSRQMDKFVRMMQAGMDVLKYGRIGKPATKTLFINEEGDVLAWTTPGAAQLVVNPKAAIPLADINKVRIGSGEYQNAVAIEAEKETLVVKVEDGELYEQLVRGLLLCVGSNQL